MSKRRECVREREREREGDQSNQGEMKLLGSCFL